MTAQALLFQLQADDRKRVEQQARARVCLIDLSIAMQEVWTANEAGSLGIARSHIELAAPLFDAAIQALAGSSSRKHLTPQKAAEILTT